MADDLEIPSEMASNPDAERYAKAAHAMQSGVALEMNHNPNPTNPKHLRVGVNSALVDSAALALLLIQKGIITNEEYVKAIADAMEGEALRYELYLREKGWLPPQGHLA